MVIDLYLKRLFLLGAVVALVTGCAGATPLPASTSTPILTSTPTPSPTPTSTTTATPTPTLTPTSTPTPTPTPIPFWDLRISTPEEQGMDSDVLVRMFDYIAEQDAEVHSVLIVRNGYLVTEAYFVPYRQSRKHPVLSCTKSFLSALIGIAIEEGYLDVDNNVLDFFPDRVVANDDPRKRAMTVEHLLRMRSGLDWPESSVSYSSSNNVLWQMMSSNDWEQFVLDRPMIAEPGARFNYSTGDPQLLAAVLEEATGMSTQEFARTHLFEPLGVSSRHWSWQSAPEGVSFGGGGLSITPRAMAKFGYLYLEDGVWNGQQIIPTDWVATSVAGPYYGYQWWRLGNGGYAALGYKGQRIAVLPHLEMVVVITGEFSGTTSGYLVDAFIIPAARSSDPLPENPEGLALLESRIHEVGPGN